MSIFRTGLSIDPNSYVDAAKKQSELLDLQRKNQQRIDSTEFLGAVNRARGDIVGDAPDLSAPKSAGLRQMIPRNEDGTYGDLTAPDPVSPDANFRLGLAQESRPEAVDRSFAQSRYSRSLPIVGQLDAEGNRIGLFDAILGVRPAAQNIDPKALPFDASSAIDYARDYEVADDIKNRVITSVDKSKRIARGSNETLSDAEQKDVDMFNRNPLIYRRDPLMRGDTRTVRDAAQQQGIDDFRGSKEVKDEIKDFQESREVTIDNRGRAVRVSDGVQVGLQTQKDNRSFFDKLLDPNGFTSGFKVIQDATEKANKDITKDNYLENPAKPGREISDLLKKRKDVALAAREYYGLAQIAAQNGNMADYQNYMKVANAHKSTVDQQDGQLVYLEGMQSLNELTQGSTGRASKVWSLSSGRDVQIIKRDDGNFDVTIDGQQQRTGITPKRLADELRLQFDSDHRQRLAQFAVERAKLAFENNLQTKLELSKILAQAKTEKMKKQYDYFIKQAEEGNAKLFLDTYSGKVFVNRGGVITALQETQTEIDGKTQTTLQEVPVSQLAGGNQFLSAYN